VPSHSPTQSSAASIEVRSRPRGSAAFTVHTLIITTMHIKASIMPGTNECLRSGDLSHKLV